MEIWDRLKSLEELTKSLPPIDRLGSIIKMRGSGFVEYNVDKGTSFSINLYNHPLINISKTDVPKNGRFKKHKHPNLYEIIIVLEGKIGIEIEGETVELGPLDKVEIKGMDFHSAVALEDTQFIAISVPNEQDFPQRQ